MPSEYLDKTKPGQLSTTKNYPSWEEKPSGFVIPSRPSSTPHMLTSSISLSLLDETEWPKSAMHAENAICMSPQR
jgi:hypothetical protein